MDKIEKALRKLRKKEQEAFLLLLQQIKADYRKVPGIKRLTGKRDLFRVRMGRYRILFTVHKQRVEIRRITKRDDRTYDHLN